MTTPLARDFQPSITDEVKFNLPAFGPNFERRSVKYFPNNGAGATFSPSGANMIQFILNPEDLFIDTKTLVMAFDLTTSSNSTHFDALSYHCLIDRVRITSGVGGGQLLEDITDWATLSQIFVASNVRVDDLNGHMASECISPVGWKRESTYNTIDLTTGNQPSSLVAASTFPNPTATANTFAVELPFSISGLLHSNKLLPVKYLKGITIQVFLRSAAQAMAYASSSSVTYSVSNVSIKTDVIKPDDSIMSELDNVVSKQGLKLHYDSYWNYQTSQGSGTSETLYFRDTHQNLKGLYAAVRQSTNAGTNMYPNLFQLNGMQTYQIKIGNYIVNSFPIDISRGEAYKMASQSVHGFSRGVVSNYNYVGTGGVGFAGPLFFIGQDLEWAQDVLGGCQNSFTAGVPIQFILQNSGATANQTFSLFIHYDALVEVSPQGSVSAVY